MNDLIVEAINHRRVLSFTYKEIERVVNPYAYGINSNGHEVLLCVQSTLLRHSGPVDSSSLATLYVAKISGLRETGDTFASTSPAYATATIAMSTIFARLE